MCGCTDFVREVAKDEHADDRSGESDGRQSGTVVVLVNKFLPVDSS
jgi:hypothetical protein